MTNEDIIKAAFKVWGRELYRTTSLAEIAQELGVSKPALYRHFKDKDALLDAMYTSYYDDCASFIKPGCEKAAKAESCKEAYILLMRTITEYYLKNREAFGFSLVRVYNSRDKEIVNREFAKRGIDFNHLVEKIEPEYPPVMQLVMATLVFFTAEFHRKNGKSIEEPTSEEINNILSEIEGRIKNGLGMDKAKMDAINYEDLERRAARMLFDEAEDNTLLKAVAEAIAEGGPWDTSMEMVAKRSGLSKSGLYAHFKNKQDMLGQLFITEFNRMVNFAKAQIETSEIHEDQLYLAIITIVHYLRERREILLAIDKLKTRQLELGKEIYSRLFRIIKSIKLEAIRNFDTRRLVDFAQWILFMIVNTLAWRPIEIENNEWLKNVSEVSNKSFRFLFRYIALGLEGVL